jgi:glutamyl-tRNA synthetase
MEWLGLTFDEGPLLQSGRTEIYNRALAKMLSDGTAFRCFVPIEEARRSLEEQQSAGATSYFSPDRELTPQESQRRADAGESHVIRFRCPPGETVFTDLIRGEIRIDHQAVGDIVLARSDGFPTYNFVVVVDDSDMGITHVVRGEDHISNTPKQILIFQALGHAVPAFAHLPLILGSDKRKLSKRHGDVTTDAYQEMGILPEAFVNHLALLGWSPGDDQEIFTREELVERFTLERVGKAGAVFDLEKLRWMNGMHLRALSDEAFIAWAREAPTLREAIQSPEFDRTALLMKARANTWEELGHLLEPFFTESPSVDEVAEAKHLGKPTAAPLLQAAADALEAAPDFQDHEALENVLRGVAEKSDVKFGLLVHPCRVSLTGRDKGAGLTEVMVALGRERTLRRLRRGAERATELNR